MNRRHTFRAGNVADVLKHPVPALCRFSFTRVSIGLPAKNRRCAGCPLSSGRALVHYPQAGFDVPPP
ncbi:MAG: hypothetical protein GEU91_17395 [Rhizobiales bacterium]|nr:hypothetical protein [Hyphomicrobiales bacterium]